MSTITIDAVPDELNALLATPEGMARARAAVLAAFPELHEREEAEGEDLQELIAAVNEGLAAIKAGEKGLTPEEVDARMKAKFPFLNEKAA